MTDVVQLSITGLGAQGDGLADHAGNTVFVPGALPGETVTAAVDGTRASGGTIDAESEHRARPVCIHFGTCGGCTAQHMGTEIYADWKRGIVADALARRGIDVNVEPVLPCAPATRRRAVFSAVNHGRGEVGLGFMEAGSRRLVDLTMCAVVTPGLEALRPALKGLAETVLPPGKLGTFTVLETEVHFDVAIAVDQAIHDDTRRGLVKALDGTGIGRLTVNGETLFAATPPVLVFDDVRVLPPPGSFVQAVQSAEQAMASLVCGHVGKAKRVVDLFAGCGTFAMRLARRSAVHAVESDKAALGALERAWRDQASTHGLRRLSTEARDLFMSPVPANDLDDFDAIVFDPPRAGAAAQVKQMVRASVPRIAAVSCNPLTLADDLKRLVDVGYVIERVVPIDQFLWSPHVEVVALLTKPRQKKRRGLV